jgi:hexosaminidase
MSMKIKRTIRVMLLSGLMLCASSACAGAAVTILPKPQQMTVGDGHFLLDAGAGISAPDDKRGVEIAEFLHKEVQRQIGIDLPVGLGTKAHRIVLQIDPAIAGDESYRLQVTTQGIRITASQDRGLFWGVQTLRQLLPMQRSTHVELPVVDIRDQPTFGYRGTMLDVSRHFYPVAFVKKQLDLLSYYKINTFHWHLTDDQGWRIEIRKYPRLTEVGGWRTEADGKRYGGFYTQAQIRDVVDYARRRNIMVIPEIEIPGHSTAALAAYPELSCTRQPLQVATSWGVHKDIYCVGNEATFTFLQNVLDEVIALFPAPYVHIGGDEVPKDRWKDCASCQQLMHAQRLKDEEGLQSYFIKRMQRYLASKGKTLIGWDEILEGGADSTAVVEVWRGDDEGRKAIANGNRIINASPYYLDTPVPKLGTAAVYRLDPAAGFTAHREQVLGAEAPLWSEYADPLNAEARLYPRLQAFAESLWTAGKRDDTAYADFQNRLQAQYPKLDALEIGYGPADANVVDYTVSLNAQRKGWQLSAKRGFPDLRNHYTINAGDPDSRSPGFLDSVDIRQPGLLKVTPFRHGRAYDHPRTFTLISQLALGKSIRLAQPPKPPYDGFANQALLDGVLGGNDPKDGTWVGWEGSDMDATVDLEKPTTIHSIDVRFMQQTESWILLPKQVTFSASADGQHWVQLQAETIPVDPADIRPSVHTVHFAALRPARARYVRIEAIRYGSLPAQHPGAGHQAWIFTDEILIR